MKYCRDYMLVAFIFFVGVLADVETHEFSSTEALLEVNFTDYDCARIRPEEQVLDWSDVFEALLEFLESRKKSGRIETMIAGTNMHLLPKVAALKEIMLKVFEGSKEREIARAQCPIGMLCLCIIETTALMTMHTEDIEPKFKCIHDLFAELPIYTLAGSKWPVFRLMEFLWGLNKIPFRQVSDYKNMNRFVQRQYADLAFTPEELAPFGVGHSVAWSSWLHTDKSGSSLANPQIEKLMITSRAAFNSFGPTFIGLVNAVWNAVERDGIPDGGRPIVRISLVFGAEWAELMPLAWARWAALGFRASVFVTMDEPAKRICENFHLICVPAGVPSVLHKYSITTLALHLGIDVLYCDLDAVPIGDNPLGFAHALPESGPTERASDLAVSTHNYDCLNAGLWFVRASDATATFFMLLLEYLYEHWYEGDQRAFNAFATGNVSVSFATESRSKFPALEISVLSPDVYAGTEGFHDVNSVQVFHAYKIYGKEKLHLVRALYGAMELPENAVGSRAKLWEWARDAATHEHIHEQAQSMLRQFQKPRAVSQCW